MTANLVSIAIINFLHYFLGPSASKMITCVKSKTDNQEKNHDVHIHKTKKTLPYTESTLVSHISIILHGNEMELRKKTAGIRFQVDFDDAWTYIYDLIWIRYDTIRYDRMSYDGFDFQNVQITWSP